MDKISNQMKMMLRIPIIILMIFFPAALQCQVSFEAKMLNVERGKAKVYHVQSSGTVYRYDFEEDGRKGTVIVDPVKGKTAILMPEEKFVHYTETSSSLSRANDPVQSLMTVKDRYTEKNLAEEKLEGYKCKRSELWADDQKIFTVWYSDELKFPLRIENHLSDETYMALTSILKVKTDASLYEVPADYTEVDRRMRPIIPEPPPPDSWLEKEVIIPFKGEFSRGDVVTFRVPSSKNYKIILVNETTDPAKVIRISLRDGKELPDNEQGPISYRTRRLFSKETESNTYSWKEGDQKKIQVHEGRLRIEVVPENK